MKRGLRWIVAGSLVTVGALVAGCPEEVTTSEAGRPAPLKARDYLFPSSPNATYVYAQTTTQWWSDKDQPEVSTFSLKIKATRLMDNEAVFVAEMLDFPVLGTVPLATFSLTAASDGTVRSSVLSILGTDNSLGYPDAALTSKGATIRPASGSTPALVMARVAKEAVTVPAGNFETLKVRQQEEGEDAPHYYWLAKGMGLFGVKQTETSTKSWPDDTTSTKSSEMVLKSYTP